MCIVWSTTTRTRVGDATAVTFSVTCCDPLKLYRVSGNIFRKWFALYIFLLIHEYLIIMWSPTVNLIYSGVKCPQSSDGQRQDQSLLGVAGGFLLLMDVDDLDDRVHQLSLYLGVVEDRSSWSRRRRCSQTWVWRLITATVSLCTQQTNLPIFVLLSLAARGALRNGDFHLSVSLVVCHIFLMQLGSRFFS